MQFCKSLENNHYGIGVMSSDINADLFHELLHWYHAMRNPVRYYDEKLGFQMPIVQIVRKSPFCQTIWDCNTSTADDEILCSTSVWNTNTCDDVKYLDLEELRTILGTKKQNTFFEDSLGIKIATFLEGDELNENLYRKFANLPFRFGYSTFNYYEDRSVIDGCFSRVNDLYADQPWNFLAKESHWNNLLSSYEDSTEKMGIGNCRIPTTQLTYKGIVGTLKKYSKNIYSTFAHIFHYFFD
jgi:hypothetical protein